MTTFGEKLKSFCDSRYNGNVADFAEELGINRTELYRYFKDIVVPKADFLMKLKKVGCDMNWLLSEDDGPPVVKEPNLEYKNKKLEEEKAELQQEIEKLRTTISAEITSLSRALKMGKGKAR